MMVLGEKQRILGVPLNQWSFVSATWDGTTMRLYKNGVEVTIVLLQEVHCLQVLLK